MHSAAEIIEATAARETATPGRARVFAMTFLGPFDRGLACRQFGHWCRPDVNDFHRDICVVRAMGRPMELEYVSYENERARGVLVGEELDPPGVWNMYFRRLAYALSLAPQPKGARGPQP